MKLKTLLIILGFLVLGLIIGYAYDYFHSPKPEPETSVEVPVTETPKEAPKPPVEYNGGKG